MKGNEILLASDPQGVFLEGIVSGTPKPGTNLSIKAATEPVGGRFTWEVWSLADGAYGLTAILLADVLQGKLSTDAYVTGTRCFLYCPIAGEEMNILVQNLTGTADTHAIGDLVSPDGGTGTFIANSSHEKPSFTMLETMSALTGAVGSDTLGRAMYNG